MNKLTEIKNHKVLYDGKDGKLILPLNFGAIKELVPWLEQEHTINQIKGSQGFPYILLTKDKSYIILDTGSKMPTLYSGTYKLFNEGGWNHNTPHQVLAHKKEIADLLKLKYTPKQRIKFNMPYTEEELVDYANKNQFAKTVYDIINSKKDSEQKRKLTDKLINFLGDKVEEYDGGDCIGSDCNDYEEVEFNDDGITLYTSPELYKANYLTVDEDSDWVFDSAMNDYDDCEEMDSEELTYIDSHFSDKTNNKFEEFIKKYEPDFIEEEGITTPFDGYGEGVYNLFLETFFPEDWERDSWDILEIIGCSVYRSRKQSVQNEIQDEITYPFEQNHHYGRSQIMYETSLSYSQLLQLIGSLGLKNFSELREWDINAISYNLSDTWYDAWDMDELALKEINVRMGEIIDNLDNTFEDNYKDIKQNKETLKQILKDLKFEKLASWRGERWVLKQNKKMIHLENYDPIENTIVISSTPKDGTVGGRKTIDVDDLSDEVTNLKIPFPEEKDKKD